MADPPVSNSIEAEFARRLAGNEKKTRDRALKKLRQFMDVRSQKSDGGFSRDDMLRIWKGLFYCMWMSDKPLVQEELAKTISDLMLQVKNVKTAMLFFESCLTTMGREWKGIDRLRMDKFYLLVRCVLNRGMEFLKRLDWEEGTVDWFLAILKNGPVSCYASPIGLHYHISDIYIEELSKVGGTELGSEVVTKFLAPYCDLMAKSPNFDFVKAAKANIFQELIENSEVALKVMKEEEQEFASAGGHSQLEASDDSPTLQVDYKTIADQLFDLASKDGILSRNRKIIYSVVKQFKELAAGRLPLDSIPDIDDSSDDELKKSEENLVDSLVSQQDEETVQNRKRMRGKKRKKELLRELERENNKLQTELEDHDAEEESTPNLEEADVESAPTERKKKKKGVVKDEDTLTKDKKFSHKRKLKIKKLKKMRLLMDLKVDAPDDSAKAEPESQFDTSSDQIARPVILQDSTAIVRLKKKKKRDEMKAASLQFSEEHTRDSGSVSKSGSEDSDGKLKKKKTKKRKKKLSITDQHDEQTELNVAGTKNSQRTECNSKKELSDTSRESVSECTNNRTPKKAILKKEKDAQINNNASFTEVANIPDILQNVPDTEKPEKRSTKEPVTKGEKDLLDWLKTARPMKPNVENQSKHDNAPSSVVTNVSSPGATPKQRKGKKSRLSLQGDKLVQMKSPVKAPVTSAFFRVAASKVSALMENKHLAAIKRKNVEPVRAHSPKRVAFEMSKTQVQPFRKMDKSIAVSPSPNNVAFDPRKKPDFGLLKNQKFSSEKTPKKRKQAADFF